MARLGDIIAPVVVVCGTKDVMTPPKYSAYLRDHISGAELHLIEGAGHMVMLEKPAEVVRALAALVEKS
jgi:pimeloyl-ACP methyl ester carboxylesterase